MDSWDRLIRAAETRMPEVVELLWRLRDVGCELERQPSGRWRIRYGKAVASGRVTEAEVRDRWLRPNAEKLRVALALLEEAEQPANEQPTQTEAGGQAKAEPSDVGGLDPRPDLADDHDMWEVILAEARACNRRLPDGHTLEELFHFLRCAGVTVSVQHGRQGPYLRLVWEPVCAPEQDESGRWVTWMRPEAFRRTYLEPYKEPIAEHLRHIMEVMQRADGTRAAA